jgi:hypothetical protein
LRSGRSGSAGQWIALGGLLGIGLLNKFSVMWLGAGLFVGLVATPHRQVLRSPWPWLGGGLAGLLLLPHLLWQAAHGWPTAEFVAAATAHKMVPVSPLDLFGQQVLVWNPLLLPLWLAGFVALLRRPAGDSGRVLAIVYATTAAILIANGTSRPNYLALAAPPLIAAGAVAFERAALRSRRSWTVPAYATLVAVVGLAATPMTLPVLPVTDLLEYSRALQIRAPQMERREIGALDPHFADMHGWERIVETIAEVHSALPPGDRSRAAILATSYSAAGAIDRFGPAYGLPGAISGHNNYWLWGPGKADGSVVIIAGGAREVWEQHWNSVEAAAVWNCGLCLPARNHATVYVARAPKAPLAQSWASLRHYH